MAAEPGVALAAGLLLLWRVRGGAFGTCRPRAALAEAPPHESNLEVGPGVPSSRNPRPHAAPGTEQALGGWGVNPAWLPVPAPLLTLLHPWIKGFGFLNCELGYWGDSRCDLRVVKAL